jgi:hypothetical protein
MQSQAIRKSPAFEDLPLFGHTTVQLVAAARIVDYTLDGTPILIPARPQTRSSGPIKGKSFTYCIQCGEACTLKASGRTLRVAWVEGPYVDDATGRSATGTWCEYCAPALVAA